MQPAATGGSSFSDRSKDSTRQSEGYQSNRSDPFGGAKEKPKVDFDSAFADFGTKKPTTGASNGTGDVASKFNKEFPPIEDLGKDDDEDTSDDDRGFDDDFTQSSPQQNRKEAAEPSGASPPAPSEGTGNDSFLGAQRPSLSQYPTDLPTPNAQQSPPAYGETFQPHRTLSGDRDPNSFPPEFGDLLPSREDPTNEPHSVQSPGHPAGGQGGVLFGGQGQYTIGGPNSSNTTSTAPTNTFGTSPQPTEGSMTDPSSAYHSATSHVSQSEQPRSPVTAQPAPIRPTQHTFRDDFDSGFDDMEEAKAADDDKLDDDEFFSSHHREGADEFNPTFDTPSASKSNTAASQQNTPIIQSSNTASRGGDSSFGNFTPMDQSTTSASRGGDSFNDFDNMTHSFMQAKPVHSPQPQQPATNHDWDAIFSGLDNPNPSTSLGQSQHGPSQPSSSTSMQQKQPQSPQLHGEAAQSSSSAFTPGFTSATQTLESEKGKENEGQPPQLGRALSASSEHDDPILKDLTGMGYPRNKALSALERFDYDKQKVSLQQNLHNRGR